MAKYDNLTFGDGVVLGHPAGQHGVLAQPVDLGQGADSLRGDHDDFGDMTRIFWRKFKEKQGSLGTWVRSVI